MLPGKLCIGIVEEDNPQKSYFQMRPVLVDDGGEYVRFEETEAYPSEGCLRIVPDKNESSHFKIRMRQLGRYCVMDLREHETENDKIRQNKNYRGDEGERNAFIVYSDVIREPAPGMIFEVLDAAGCDSEGRWEGAPFFTEQVILENESGLQRPVLMDDGTMYLRPDGDVPEDVQYFEFDCGETHLRFAIRKSGGMEQVVDKAPVRPEPATVEVAPPERKPEPVRTPETRHARLTEDQLFAAQCGLNPHRNRSLQEIIEDKWRHSRVDQLGHPVPVNAMGQPIDNPVDTAMTAIRRVWDNPALHQELVRRLGDMEAFLLALTERRENTLHREISHELENLEAERLMAIDELARLRKQKENLRETLKSEIRAEEAESLRVAVEQTREAQVECEKYRAQADEARDKVRLAEDAFASLTDGRFEERLRDFALSSRAAKLFSGNGKAAGEKGEARTGDALTRAEWIDRVVAAFEAAGLPITPADAANYLVCFALSDAILLSGAASADKLETARALANAFGAQAAGRYREVSKPSFENDAPDRDSELPAIAFIPDANARPQNPVYRGLCGKDKNLVVVAAVSDTGSGFPVGAEALERGFFIRIAPVAADAPWHVSTDDAPAFAPATVESLRRAFLLPEARVPAELELRLRNLREALRKYGVYLSRRTLNLMYRYCTAMIDTGLVTPEDAFDRAFAQKALPVVLAEAPVKCLAELRELLTGMPVCLSFLAAPLPIML